MIIIALFIEVFLSFIRQIQRYQKQSCYTYTRVHLVFFNCDLYCIDYSIFNFLNSFVMKKNMGTADRVIRVLVAAILAYLYFSGTVTGNAGLFLAIFGGIIFLGSILGFCPLYTLFGFSTCSNKTA